MFTWEMAVNPLTGTSNYSATSNNMNLVHWPLMGGLLHLVQRGGDWVGPQPAQENGEDYRILNNLPKL